MARHNMQLLYTIIIENLTTSDLFKIRNNTVIKKYILIDYNFVRH